MTFSVFTSGSRFKGSTYQDPKSKSTVTVPIVSPIDLIGCGVMTHIKGNQGYTLNSRAACTAPKLGLGVYVSWQGAITPATVGDGASVMDPTTLIYTDSPAGEGTDVDVLGIYPRAALYHGLIDAIFVEGINEENNNNSSFRGLEFTNTLTDSAQLRDAFRETGNQIVYGNLKDIDLPIEVSFTYPIVERLIDQCDVEAQVKAKGSVTVMGYDSETCRSSMIYQSSMTIILDPDYFGRSDATVSQLTGLDAAVFNRESVFPPSFFQVANLANAAPGAVRARFVNAMNTEGSFVTATGGNHVIGNTAVANP